MARRIRELLERGTEPEAVGVVARDLEPYRVAIRLHFGRLGIPFATAGARGMATATSRRVAALLAVLARGAEAPVDAWLAAAAHPGDARLDVRVGLRACGAIRVADVAALAVDSVLGDARALSLPIRRGLAQGGGDDEPDERPPGYRGGTCRGTSCSARWTRLRQRWQPCTRFRGQRRAAPTPVQCARSVGGPLGWCGDTAGADEVEAALAHLAGGLPPELALDRDEFVAVLTGQLGEAGRARLGGEGGVRVLDVTEARALTFGHLFLIGLNRDSFPRQVREDPLLPDRVRLALEPLPSRRAGEVARARRGALPLRPAALREPQVTISWRTADDESKAETASPLVEHLRLAGKLPDLEDAPDLASPESGGARPAHERALLAGLAAGHPGFAAVLRPALAENRRGAGGERVTALAAARLAVLDELDPDRRSAAGRARWAARGLLRLCGSERRRRQPPERRPGGHHARRARGVRVANVPAAAPAPRTASRSARRRSRARPNAGRIARPHRAAADRRERRGRAAVRADRRRSPANRGRCRGRPRPSSRRSSPRRRARRRATPGSFSPASPMSSPGQLTLLEAAAESDWAAGNAALPVAGVEVERRYELSSPAGRRVVFKADRVEQLDDRVRLTDYKSGRPRLPANDERRRLQLLREVAAGTRLQAAAYALSVGERAEGRYLFLGVNPEEKPREGALDNRDQELAPAFAAALATLFAAWERGAFFPRPVDPRKARSRRAASGARSPRRACAATPGRAGG